jgi:hypothetical protein
MPIPSPSLKIRTLIPSEQVIGFCSFWLGVDGPRKKPISVCELSPSRASLPETNSPRRTSLGVEQP